VGLIFVPQLREDRVLYLVVSLTIIFDTIGMEWLYKALEQYSYIAIRSMIFKLIALVGMFLLVKSKDDYVIYGGLTILAASASSIFNFFHARKYISMRPMGGYKLSPHLKAVAIFFAMTCASTVYTNLDTVMLGFMRGETVVGYYDAAVKIKSILVSIVTSLGVVLLPRASYYVERGLMEEFRSISRKALNFVFVAALPMMLYFMLFARQGILLLSGEGYDPSVSAMQIIMPTLLFIGLSNILGIQILVPMGKEKVVLWSLIVGAVVDVIINILLIPGYGAAGAAAGTMVAEFAVLVYQFVVLRKEVWPSFRKISYWKLILALVVATAASIWVLWLDLGLLVTLILSAVLFFGCYGAMLLILKENMTAELLKQILGKFLKKK
jgi:O-antigen/teichoic acid export membrane protein